MNSKIFPRLFIGLLAIGLVIAIFAAARGSAAVTPTLSLWSPSSGNVQMSVHADPNMDVTLSYYPNGSSVASSIGVVGVTDSSGNYTTVLNSNVYGIQFGWPVFVVVNGMKSSSVSWPAYGGGYYNNYTPVQLSTNYVTLQVGQNYFVNVSGGNNFSASSDSNVVTAHASDGEVSLFGQYEGEGNVNVCNTSGSCASIHVRVVYSNPVYNDNGNYNPCDEYCGSTLQLTQTSARLGLKQSINLISLNGSALKAKASSNVVKASVYGGNQITLVGQRVGTATVSVCSTSLGCRDIKVTVQKTAVPAFKVSASKLNLGVGQTYAVTPYNGSGVTAYSNSNVISTSMDGSKILISAVGEGKATITVCSSNAGCLPIYVTVKGTYNPYNNNNCPSCNCSGPCGNGLRLSTMNVTLTVQQQYNVTVSTSNNVTASSDSISVRTAVNGNKVTLYGTYQGNANVTICSQYYGCKTVAVKVNPRPTTPNRLTLNQTNINLQPGQSYTIGTSYGNNITASSNSNIVTASVSYNTVTVRAIAQGTATVTVCSTNAGCASAIINVKDNQQTNPPNNNNYQVFKSVTVYNGQTIDLPLRSDSPTTYYISSNSNPSAVYAYLGSTSMTIRGLAAGTAVIKLCPHTGFYSCGIVNVTVRTDTLSPFQTYSNNENQPFNTY